MINFHTPTPADRPWIMDAVAKSRDKRFRENLSKEKT